MYLVSTCRASESQCEGQAGAQGGSTHLPAHDGDELVKVNVATPVGVNFFDHGLNLLLHSSKVRALRVKRQHCTPAC